MNSTFESCVSFVSELRADRSPVLRGFDLEFAYQRVLTDASAENFAAFVTAYRRTGNAADQLRDYLLACAEDVAATNRARAGESPNAEHSRTEQPDRRQNDSSR